MRHEVRAIPPAPRRIRLRPLFAHRWPLLALGAFLVAGGALIAWAMFLQSGGKFSKGPLLDAGPTARTTGRVEEVWPTVHFDGRDWQNVRYRASWDDVPPEPEPSPTRQTHRVTLEGESFVPAGRYRVGDEVAIEVLRADMDLHRIVGGVLHIDRAWLRARFWLIACVAPGGLLLLGWLAGAFQLRHVLVHGDVAVGTIHRVVPVRFVLPEMLAIDYTFRDHRATHRHNRHWVRTHGALGARLRTQLRTSRFEDMPVLHSRALPQWNRLVLPADFLAPPAPIALAESDQP